ncbi:helix-turn-helix domain-containing protein [Phaeacidiphilus oryzae]|uniref:helix-turn-helix domain-containing protein n=1 Tax=Phaeacidiphilus oryzae TaxID=348818 RepID=UPI00055AC5D0|nr:helix-turn-helix transcriptional regulator [Phaeacidiphilus oryzae]
MSTQPSNEARVIPLRPQASPPPGSGAAPRAPQRPAAAPGAPGLPGAPAVPGTPAAPPEPLLRDLVGDVLRRERLAQRRTLKDVSETARISMPYLSELERGRKEGSSEVLAAAARALGLGLGDLLSLAQDELARYAPSVGGRAGHGRTTPTARYDGLCLAA